MNLYDMGVSHEMVRKISRSNFQHAMTLQWISVGNFHITRMQWENQGGE